VVCHVRAAVFVARLSNVGVGGCYLRGLLTTDSTTARLSFRERGLAAPFASGRIVRRNAGLGFAIVFSWIDPAIPQFISSLESLSFSDRLNFILALKPELDLY
jgi:hypothetical protein